LEKWVSSNFKAVLVSGNVYHVKSLNYTDYLNVIKVEPISFLLTEENLAKNDDYGFHDSLDHDKLQAFFTARNPEYCRKVLQLTKQQCEAKLGGY